MRYISGVWDLIIILFAVLVVILEVRQCLLAMLLKHKAKDAADDLDMKALRKCSEKLSSCVSWHSFTGVIITIFPLLGMFGTVLGLLGSAENGTDDVSSFLTALTTTFWGIIASIITKGIEAVWIKFLMDIENTVAPYEESISTGSSADRYYRKGLRYEKGEGVPEDEEEAFHCFRQAAELGNPDAQYKMGEFAEKGINCRKSSKEAEYWYRKSFDGGNDKAGIALRRIYSQGEMYEKKDGRS